MAIDRGVINAIADSDGRLVKSPRYYGRSLQRLARAQRTVSRRKKGSKNREKAKLALLKSQIPEEPQGGVPLGASLDLSGRQVNSVAKCLVYDHTVSVLQVFYRVKQFVLRERSSPP